MRLLLPTVHGRAEKGALLLGPSAIGEDFLYEDLERQWGMSVRSGSLSMGTVDDCYLFLSYIERAYGPQALPRRLVLGMQPRVLANLPRLFGSKTNPKAFVFLISFIDRYSTRFRAQMGELGTELVAKTAPEKAVAWLRFYLTKQQPRYRAGVLALIEHSLDPDVLKVGFQQDIPDFSENIRWPLTRLNIRTTISFVRDVGPARATRLWLRAYRTAYHGMFVERVSDAEIREIVAHDEMAFAWHPRDEEAMVSMQLDRLARLVERNGIELIVVHLPEYSAVRAGYDPDKFAAYREVLEQRLPTARFVDLWSTIPDELFFDEVHLKYEGARRATNLLVAALERQKG
jgi:hypothetical protein